MSSLTIKAKLVAEPLNVPRCGDMKFAVAYKFLLQQKQVDADSDTVCVLILCPDLKGENFFVIENTYRIEMTSDLKESVGYAVINDYKSENMSLYLAKTISKF